MAYHWLSVNERLCLIDGVEKVIGLSQPRWNRQRPVLYPSNDLPPRATLSFIINSFDKSMLEDGSMFGD